MGQPHLNSSSNLDHTDNSGVVVTLQLATPTSSLVARSTLILFASFAIVIMLAIIGTVLNIVYGADKELIKEAMRIVGVTGPTGTAAQSAIDAFGKKNQQSAPIPDPPSPWGKT